MKEPPKDPGCDVCHAVLTAPDEYLFIEDPRAGVSVNLCNWPCVAQYAAMRAREQIEGLLQRVGELEAPDEPYYGKPGE